MTARTARSNPRSCSSSTDRSSSIPGGASGEDGASRSLSDGDDEQSAPHQSWSAPSPLHCRHSLFSTQSSKVSSSSSSSSTSSRDETVANGRHFLHSILYITLLVLALEATLHTWQSIARHFLQSSTTQSSVMALPQVPPPPLSDGTVATTTKATNSRPPALLEKRMSLWKTANQTWAAAASETQSINEALDQAQVVVSLVIPTRDSARLFAPHVPLVSWAFQFTRSSQCAICARPHESNQ
jgi:hypothetical protein